eukprot:gene26832-34666_t
MAALVFVCYFGDHCIGPWAEDTSETKAAEKQTMLRYWSTWRPGRGAVVPITSEVENRLKKVDPLTGQLIVDEEEDNGDDSNRDDRIFGDDRAKRASSAWLPFRQKPTAASHRPIATSSGWWPFQSPTAARRYRLSTAAAAKEGQV